MSTNSGLSELETEFIEYRRKFNKHWRDKPEEYWLARLLQEVGELSGSTIGEHEHPVELELMQIAGICLNWLEMRQDKRPGAR